MANSCLSFITVQADNNQDYTDFMSWWKEWMIDKIETIEYLSELNVFSESERESGDVIGLVGSKRIRTSYFDINNGYIQCESAWAPFPQLLQRLCITYHVNFEVEYEEAGNDIGGHIAITEDCIKQDAMSYVEFLMKYDDERVYQELLNRVFCGFDEEDLHYDTFKSFYGDDWDRTLSEAQKEMLV